MLVNRYTIVTLPAWIIVFAVGWEKIKSMKLKYALSMILVLSTLVNIVFFRQHYARLKKDQYREASEIVLTKNKFHYPVYSTLWWHYSFYFRNSNDKVSDFYTAGYVRDRQFWLLQAHSSEDEMEADIKKLNENFNIIERHSLFGTNAILFGKKIILSNRHDSSDSVKVD